MSSSNLLSETAPYLTNREIFQSESKLKRYHKEGRRCTCGEKPEKCQYWGPILQDNNLINEVDYYNCCLRYTEKFMDEGNTVFIDSSKSIKRLNKVVQISSGLGASLYPIHIIKHYRAQNLSVKKYSRGKSFLYRKSMTLRGHVHWIISNTTSILYLYIAKRRALIEDFKIIMYEDLVFEKIKLLESISADWKFLEKWDRIQRIKGSCYHEMGGNEGFKTATEKIIYNHKWLFESNVFSPILWIPLEIIYKLFKSVSQEVR